MKNLKKKFQDFETTIDLNMDAFIPDSYISNEYQKLDIYKRIAGIETQQDYDDMLEELLDRFGEMPKAVMNLLSIARLKALAHRCYVTEIKQKCKTESGRIPCIDAEIQTRSSVQKRAGTEDFIYTGGKRKCADSPYGSADRA